MKKEELNIPRLFGEQVKKYRNKKGLTQEQLSERLGISQKHLSIIETGTQFASASLIEKISKELNVPPSLLFGGSENNEIRSLVGIMTSQYNDLLNKISLLNINLQNEITALKTELKERR